VKGLSRQAFDISICVVRLGLSQVKTTLASIIGAALESAAEPIRAHWRSFAD
jgi:hypothetical protein